MEKATPGLMFADGQQNCFQVKKVFDNLSSLRYHLNTEGFGQQQKHKDDKGEEMEDENTQDLPTIMNADAITSSVLNFIGKYPM